MANGFGGGFGGNMGGFTLPDFSQLDLSGIGAAVAKYQADEARKGATNQYEADVAKNLEGANYSTTKMLNDAHNAINSSILSMNPIPGKDTTKGQEISDKDAYFKWVKEEGYGPSWKGLGALEKVKKAEAYYQRTLRRTIKKVRRDKDWQRRFGTLEHLTYDK